MKHCNIILGLSLVLACTGSRRDETADPMNTEDAGTAPSSDERSSVARKVANATEPAPEQGDPTITESDASAPVDASMKSNSPSADAGTAERTSDDAGSPMGQAGQSAASAGQGSASSSAAGAGGTAGEAGASAAGASAAGMGGAGGASGAMSSNCPLGDADADGNGYPDACETLLWEAEGGSSAPLDLVGLDYSSSMNGFFTVAAGDSVHCPELNGTNIASLGHATLFPSGDPASSRILDAQSDVSARTLAICFERDDAVPIALNGYLANKSVTDTDGARVLYDTQPFRNHINAGAPTTPPMIAGKHILYFRITMRRLSITAYDSTLGTTVLWFDATVEAIGY